MKYREAKFLVFVIKETIQFIDKLEEKTEVPSGASPVYDERGMPHKPSPQEYTTF